MLRASADVEARPANFALTVAIFHRLNNHFDVFRVTIVQFTSLSLYVVVHETDAHG